MSWGRGSRGGGVERIEFGKYLGGRKAAEHYVLVPTGVDLRCCPVRFGTLLFILWKALLSWVAGVCFVNLLSSTQYRTPINRYYSKKQECWGKARV